MLKRKISKQENLSLLPNEKKKLKSKEKEVIPYFRLVLHKNPYNTKNCYVLQEFMVILAEQLSYPFVVSSHALTIHHIDQ